MVKIFHKCFSPLVFHIVLSTLFSRKGTCRRSHDGYYSSQDNKILEEIYSKTYPENYYLQ